MYTSSKSQVNFWADVLAHLAMAEGEVDLMDVNITIQPQPSISTQLVALWTLTRQLG